MKNLMTRTEAEAFVRSFKPFDIFLDEPDWAKGFDGLRTLWDEARGERTFPSNQDVDIVQVPVLVPLIQIYQTTDPSDPSNLEVIYQGGDLVRFSREETGPYVYTSECKKKKDQETFLTYTAFAKSWPHPFWANGHMCTWRRKRYAQERYISLPTSSDGALIDGNITASHYHDPL